jgi:3-deoxy-D-manno-octulosonic-acid transferase
MRLFLYNCIIFILLPILAIRLFFKNLKDKDYAKNFSHRLGLHKGEYNHDSLWFHAVSLGEVISSQVIVRKLLKDNNVILSVSTPTGLREAKKIYDDRLLIVYAPWDLKFFVKSFLDTFKPKALILFETEIWPSMVHECWKRNMPVILSNARLSESSSKKYKIFKSLTYSTLNKFSLILAQSNDHVDRFKGLGINNDIVVRVGSTKFDFELEESLDLKRITQANNYILAASTHKGEDEIVIESYKKLKKEFTDLKLILVPRHPERANAISEILIDNNICHEVSSDLNFNTNVNDVIVISSTGLLNSLYKLSRASFIGGSLFSRYGGHNIIEAAFNKNPFIIGPYMKNFKDVLDLFLARNACLQIKNPNQLSDAYKKLLENNELRKHLIDNALKVIDENQGSSEEQYKQIINLIN